MPGLIDDSLVQPAVTAILGRPEEVKLALWHGFNLPLLLSVVTFALGLGFYAVHGRLRAALTRFEAALPATADQARPSRGSVIPATPVTRSWIGPGIACLRA